MNTDDSILLALGANLPSSVGPPQATLEAALDRLSGLGVSVVERSPWYRSAPVPPSGQDWYVNGVARVETKLDPEALLALLHETEAHFGRQRKVVNEARVIDLDLLAYGRLIRPAGAAPHLPHPRMCERAFVLLPLRDAVSDWRHPQNGETIETLISRLPGGQIAEIMMPDRAESVD